MEISGKICGFSSDIQVVFQWKSAVKFGGNTSFISVVYQWNISDATTSFQWYTSGKNRWYYHCYQLI